MKSYTDIEQSKKLAEILPLESADMFYRDNGEDVKLMWEHIAQKVTNPCWSLAALLEQIPSDLGSKTLTIEKDDSEPLKYGLNYHDTWGRDDEIQTKYYDDLINACYEMIIKLHELNLL